MSPKHLIRMANGIADFFISLPDHDEAVEGVADHIRKFWEPRMRLALLDFVAAHPDGVLEELNLKPLVLQAVARNIERLRPAAAPH
jgi:formate dehydrogenase subunit delta